MKVGWIGLGAMGAPMAGHLQAAGLLVGAWNRGEARRAAFAERYPDASLADSPDALAEANDVLALCVAADADLAAVLDRVESALKPGAIVVDHSTVSPAAARSAAERLAARDVAFVDAPVTGGVEGAKNGQLAIMAGGDEAAFERLAPVFAAYGKAWRHLGPSGSGQSAKAVNQLIVAGIAEAVCEALALVEKLDLPQDAMLELLGGGAAGNWFLDKRGRTMLDDSFETGFEPALLLKDLEICRALADEVGFASTVLPGALTDYQRLVDGGETGKDISALIRIKR